MKANFTITILNLFLSVTVCAGTFTGNGGNSLDVQLGVTLKRIHDTFSEYQAKEVNNLCQCYDKPNQMNICSFLNKLSAKQVIYCGQYLLEKKQSLIELTKSSSDVVFNWSERSLNVIEDGKKRYVESVTHPEEKTITINHNHFRQLDSYQQIILVTHELLHLVPHQGAHLMDQNTIGPFDKENGVRHLFNALGTATAVNASYFGYIDKYNSILTRSNNEMKHWLSFSLLNTKANEEDANHLLKSERSQGYRFSYRYQPGAFGAYWEYDILSFSGGDVVDVEANEGYSSIGIGGTFKQKFFKDSFTYWGQSYLLLKLGVFSTAYKYWVKDKAIKLEDSDQSIS